MTARYPDLAGKVAVVTGASRGIGAATARAFAANGAAVALVGRDDQALAAVAAAIGEDGGRAVGIRADCTVDRDVEELLRQVGERLGGPDILAAFAVEAACRSRPSRRHRPTGERWWSRT